MQTQTNATIGEQLEIQPRRDNVWLLRAFNEMLKNHFSDVEIKNQIIVRFGQASKARLGSIKYGPVHRRRIQEGRHKPNPHTFITITGYFQDTSIPDYVVLGVLGHEMAHYAHGFFSPLPQLYEHPHKHQIIDKELTKRGLDDILKLQKAWLKQNWRTYLEQHGN